LATADGVTKISAQLLVDGEPRTITGSGNGPIDAFVDGIRTGLSGDTGHRYDIDVVDYQEHSIGSGADANAVAYVETVADGVTRWGVGVDPNIIGASFAAVLSAVNRVG
jgi:2-isopropylmalate synthase